MIYVVTAVHNRYTITETFLNQLLSQTYSDIQLILVDDGCTDGTAEMVKEKMPNSIIIRGDGNLWWAGALHEAYKWIRRNGDRNAIVMFANDDSTFEPLYIAKAIEILKNHPKTLITGYGISKQTKNVVDGAVVFDFRKTAIQKRGVGSGNCASTRSLFFTVNDFLEIGGFHPILLPHYGSDYEWTIRACRKKGFTIYCDENLKYFVDEETTGDNQYSKLTRKKLFSKRSSSNPIYKLIMILLVTPIRLLPEALYNQAIRDFRKTSVIREILRK